MEESRHLTEDILLQSISTQFHTDVNSISIISFSVDEGCRKGDNFSCVMKAVQVVAKVNNGDERTLHYMAKCMPNGVRYWGDCTQEGMFDSEVDIYVKVLPNLAKFEEEKELKEPFISAPKVFYADKEEGIMVMEDLRKKGYYMVDKNKGLDITEVKLVLQQLALFHATSYHFMTTYPNGGEDKFKEDYKLLICDSWFRLDKMTDQFNEFLDMQGNLLLRILEEFVVGSDDDLLSKYRTFNNERKEVLNRVHRPQGNFNCLVHNDSWCNNFLFRKSVRNIVDSVQLIDFQLSRRARPTIDLVYLLGTSTNPEFRQKHTDHLLSFYHSILTKRLLELGNQDSYTLEQLKEDYRDCLPHGFVNALIHTIFQIPAESSEAALDPDTLLNTDVNVMLDGQLEFARKDEPFRNKMVALAKEAHANGVF